MVVPIRLPTVSCVPVAMRLPEELVVTMELIGRIEREVIGKVPEIVERVVVACHVGTPPTKAKTKPLVPSDVVAIAPVPLPKRSVFA